MVETLRSPCRFLSLPDCSRGKCSTFCIAHLHRCPSADQAHLKSVQKHRRQRDERTREAEIARAEAADLTLRLRKVTTLLPVPSFLLFCTLVTQMFACLPQTAPHLSGASSGKSFQGAGYVSVWCGYPPVDQA